MTARLLFVLLPLPLLIFLVGCRPKQVQDTARIAARTPVGQRLITQADDLLRQALPRMAPQPLRRVPFTVVDAAGRQVMLPNTALQAEIQSAREAAEPKLLAIVHHFQTKLNQRRALLQGELPYEQQLLAFEEVIRELGANPAAYGLSFGFIYYRQQSEVDAELYITAAAPVGAAH